MQTFQVFEELIYGGKWSNIDFGDYINFQNIYIMLFVDGFTPYESTSIHGSTIV